MKGCKYKMHNYSKISIGGMDSNDTDVTKMAKTGDKSINGLISKCVAVKKRGCRK